MLGLHSLGETDTVNGAFVHAKFALLPGEICQAITASAHKLARVVYCMLTRGQAFVEADHDEYEERCRQPVVQNLTRRAQQLGLTYTTGNLFSMKSNSRFRRTTEEVS